MFTVPIKTLVVATSLALGFLATQPAGCAPGSVPVNADGTTPSCGTHVTLKVVLHGNGPAIEEDAKTQCVHTPSTFNVVLALFRNTDGGPVQLSDSVGRLNNPCGDIPVEGTTIDCIWYVSPCLYNGSYQGLAQINGEGPDGRGNNEFFSWEEKSLFTAIRCR